MVGTVGLYKQRILCLTGLFVLSLFFDTNTTGEGVFCDTSIRIQLSPTGQIKVKLSDTMDQVILKPSWSQFYVKCITLSHFDMLISISLEQQLIPNWHIGFKVLFVIFS